tara:strand:- start:205 stop:573 length:369 start_codon:yes stop_codon:yes gene_type:complete
MDNKKIIVEVLSKFFNVNLASDSAREWIADEICKKLDNPNHNINRLHQDVEQKQGVFENYLKNIDEENKKIEKIRKDEMLMREKQSQEMSENENVKIKKPIPKRRKPKKSLKGIKKPGRDFL